MKPLDRGRTKVWGWFVAVLFLMSGLNSRGLQAQQASVPEEVLHYADTVLYNGKILTADDKFTIIEAVAIRDGKFLALGPTNRILPLAGPKTRKIDLKGKTAMPGMVDTHMHPFTEGIYRFYVEKYLGISPETPFSSDTKVEWPNPETSLKKIREAVGRVKPGEVVVLPAGDGSGGFGLCRQMSLSQLDDISPNNPVFFSSIVNLWMDGLNSKGAALLHLPPGTSAFRPPGSPCASDWAREHADSTVHWLTPLEVMMPGYRAGSLKASQWGVTTAKEHTTPVLMTGIRELWVRGELTVRMRMPLPLWPKTGNQTNPPPDEAEDLYKSLGNLSGIGDDMWRLNCVRPDAVGGNIRAGSAWTMEPKREELPGFPNRPYGDPTWYEEKTELIKKTKETFPGRESLVQAIRYGWDVATDHTVGDRAVEEVLKAMEEGLKTQVVKHPGQLLAMGHTPMATPEQMQRMKELGIRNGIGPWHVFTDAMIEAAFTQYGTERIGQMASFKSHLKAGLKPSLEGDTFDDPPFWKFYAAITRKDQKYGRVWNPAEKVTRQEALWMGTINGAYQFGEDNKLGSVEPGKLADFIVLDRDYMTIPEDDLPKIKVLLTIVGGKVVYEAQGGLK